MTSFKLHTTTNKGDNRKINDEIVETEVTRTIQTGKIVCENFETKEKDSLNEKLLEMAGYLNHDKNFEKSDCFNSGSLSILFCKDSIVSYCFEFHKLS